MAIKYNVRAKVDTDKEGKGFFKTIGRVVETKSGLMIFMESIPTKWDGWAYLSVPKELDPAAEPF